MTIDCILIAEYKINGKERWYQVELYDTYNYENDKNYELRYKLKIVHIQDNGEYGGTLSEKTIIKDGKTLYNINFCNAYYTYDSEKDIIYTTQTRRII